MTTLVVGATGATGRLLVQQLLDRRIAVRAIVRSAARLPASVRDHSGLTVTEASLLDLSDDDLARHVSGCDAVASCLGHNLSLRGILGPPHRLVTESVRRLCRAIESTRPARPVRLVLMSSAGVRNHDLDERVSVGQRIVLGLLRVLVPPHADNEQAAGFLRVRVGQGHGAVRWVAVRPDSLLDAGAVSPYEIHRSPVRSALFDPGKTSRINVADVMTRLITEDALWSEWQGRMPVVYDRD
ncbi:NAD(P)H-binding protein [bacterium]|nr:NAD(P)H-binding protein [bacterium]